MSAASAAVPAPSPSDRRRRLRAGLASGTIQRFPGAFSPLVARAVTDHGFEGVYVSGSVLAADLCLPDVGLTTSVEVAHRGGQIARVTDLPVLIDADTGFGEPANVARTVNLLEDAGIAGCHLEDQVNPKQCGHLEGTVVVERDEMVRRIRAAVLGRRDPEFVICARIDARGVEGFDAALERAKAYVDAGADMVFPEALADEAEFAAFRAAIDVPLMANMTEFGKGPSLRVDQLQDLGVDLVIWPVTTLRVALGGVDDTLAALATDGLQSAVLGRMQPKERTDRLVGYPAHQALERAVAGTADERRA